MSYINGKTGNPRGRPRKTHINCTNVDIELKKEAAKKSKQAFDFLWKAMEAKEPWAFQLYFQELLPKTDILPLEIDQDNPNKIDAITTGIIKAVGTIEYITIDEACKLINALSNLKRTESKKVEDILTEELRKTQLLWSITPEKKEDTHYVAA